MAGINRTTGKATDLITFSRASGGTALRKISYGSELVTNGTFDTDVSGWTVNNANATITWQNSKMVFTSTSFAYAKTNSPINLGTTTKPFLVSFEITDWVSGLSNVHVGLGVGGNVVTGNGTYSYIYVGSGLTEFQLRPNSGGTGGFTIDNISVKEVLFDQPDGTLTLFNHPTNIPRIEYDAAGNVKGLLIEEARTNLVAPSNDFDAAFISQTGVNVSSADGTSPDGAVNADKLIADTSTGFHRIAKTGIATSSGVDYSYSCFFKAAGETVAGLGLFDGTNWLGRASVDLTTGVASVSNGSAKVDDFGNGWYRLTVYGTSLGTSHTAYIYVKSLFSSTGNGTDGVLVYGAQLEAGSFPTSYIPTSGATATRAADIASISVDNFGYNQKAGTVVVETKTLADQVAAKRMFSFDNGSSNADSIQFAYSAGGLSSYFEVRDDTVVQVSGVPSGAISSSAFAKSAVSYKANDFAASVNSNTVFSDTSGTVPTSQTQLQIGGFIGSNQLNGHIKSIAYYPRRLSNAQLVELTS